MNVSNTNFDEIDPDKVNCVAIIPARGGSKGIPKKNLQSVGGIPLIVRSVKAALNTKSVDIVVVSTDDFEIAELAKMAGAHVIARPKEISGDTASSESALLQVLGTLEELNIKPELTVFLQCTSPFTRSNDIDMVVQTLKYKDAKVAISVCEDNSFLWKIDNSGFAIGINHDHTQPRKRRQDLPPQYRENGAIYAMVTKDFLRTGNRFCGATVVVPLSSPSFDIDTPEDLKLANLVSQLESL